MGDSLSRRAEIGGLLLGCAVIGVVVGAGRIWPDVANATTVALSFLLIVLIVAAVSTRRVAVATSLSAFACFNYFFLPPVGTFAIAKPDDWAALFALLAVSIVASHLSSQARQRARQALALLEQRNEAEMARRSAEVKSALVASLSHDLKTPLTAMTIAASNLGASWLTEEQRREQVDVMLGELERLGRLFHNMVDMASIEAHALNAEAEWVHPSEIVEAAMRQIGGALDRHVVATEGMADKMLVRIDPRLTSAALAHILENAAAYSPPGSLVTVEAAVRAGALEISVRDNGPGIAPQEVDRLFERFYRGAGSRSQKFGSGLGLAITRGLLAAGGGGVRVRNHPTGGAIFTIEMPVEIRPMPEPEEETA